jgi:hypothetical protein
MSPLPVLETPAVATHLNTYWSCKTALAWKSRRFFHPLISLLSCRRRLRLLLVTTSSTLVVRIGLQKRRFVSTGSFFSRLSRSSLCGGNASRCCDGNEQLTFGRYRAFFVP